MIMICEHCKNAANIATYVVGELGRTAVCERCGKYIVLDDETLNGNYRIEFHRGKGFGKQTYGMMCYSLEEIVELWKKLYTYYEGYDYCIFDKGGNTFLEGAMDIGDLDLLEEKLLLKESF